MTFTVFGVTYSFATAPAFIQYGIRRWTRRYGTSFDAGTPSFVRYYAHDVGTRFCVAQ
jgi:hypothetical protein